MGSCVSRLNKEHILQELIQSARILTGDKDLLTYCPQLNLGVTLYGNIDSTANGCCLKKETQLLILTHYLLTKGQKNGLPFEVKPKLLEGYEVIGWYIAQ